jgi:hypothetical protein
MLGMNKLPFAKRVQLLSMLCEGSSMRVITRSAIQYFRVPQPG